MNHRTMISFEKVGERFIIKEWDNILLDIPYEVLLLTPYDSYKDLVSSSVGYALVAFMRKEQGYET